MTAAALEARGLRLRRQCAEIRAQLKTLEADRLDLESTATSLKNERERAEQQVASCARGYEQALTRPQPVWQLLECQESLHRAERELECLRAREQDLAVQRSRLLAKHHEQETALKSLIRSELALCAQLKDIQMKEREARADADE